MIEATTHYIEWYWVGCKPL